VTALYFEAEVKIEDDPGELHRLGSPRGKPVLRIRLLPDGPELIMSCNLAEMIGGVGAGARQRWEDLHRRRN
jgi:hypothetical protein